MKHIDPTSGTASQVEWAERIKAAVEGEFERVRRSLSSPRSAALTDAAQVATAEVLAVLEEKRVAVMDSQDARYFIRDWQELSDQVRKMIVKDPRYNAIRARKAEAVKTGRV